MQDYHIFSVSHIAVIIKLQANQLSDSIGWCSSMWSQRVSKTPKIRPLFCFSTEQWKLQRQHWFVSPMIAWIFWISSNSGRESLNLSFREGFSTSSSSTSSLTSSFEGVISKEFKGCSHWNKNASSRIYRSARLKPSLVWSGWPVNCSEYDI